MQLDLDGEGKSEISTGIGFFDHMLTLFAFKVDPVSTISTIASLIPTIGPNSTDPSNLMISTSSCFVGKDTLDDVDFEDYYELLDLNIGKCYFAVAAYPEYRNKKFERRKKIASKYTKVAKKYFATKQEDVEIIKLEAVTEGK